MQYKQAFLNLVLTLFMSLFVVASFAGDLSQSCNWGGDNDLICPDNDNTAFIVNNAGGGGGVGNSIANPAVLCSKPNGDRLEGLASDECYYFWLDDSSVSHLVIPWNSKEEIESLQEYIKRIGGSNSGSCTGKKGSTVTLKGSANSPEWDCSVAATPSPVFKPKRLVVEEEKEESDDCIVVCVKYHAYLGWSDGEIESEHHNPSLYWELPIGQTVCSNSNNLLGEEGLDYRFVSSANECESECRGVNIYGRLIGGEDCSVD